MHKLICKLVETKNWKSSRHVSKKIIQHAWQFIEFAVRKIPLMWLKCIVEFPPGRVQLFWHHTSEKNAFRFLTLISLHYGSVLGHCVKIQWKKLNYFQNMFCTWRFIFFPRPAVSVTIGKNESLLYTINLFYERKLNGFKELYVTKSAIIICNRQEATALIHVTITSKHGGLEWRFCSTTSQIRNSTRRTGKKWPLSGFDTSNEA